MTHFDSIPHADPVTHGDVKEIAELGGPVASFYVPTHRSGPETTTDPQQLRELLDTARAELAERYPDTDADALLKPVEKLRDDEQFWQFQVDGLAIFATPAGTRTFRTDSEFEREVSVGEHANLRPLLPLVAENEEFLLLALSQHQVRLFAANRQSLNELELGEIPHSTHEMEGVDVHKPMLKNRGTGEASSSHGDDMSDDHTLSTFLQEAGKAIEKRFAGRKLVLASVAEHHGDLAEQLHGVELLGKPVAGNPDDLRPAQLHEEAWPLVQEEVAKRHEELVDSFGQAQGSGLGSSEAADVLSSADAGRVETLLFTATGLEVPENPGYLDAAVAKTLSHGGVVDVVEHLPEGVKFGAIYRW